MIRIIVAFLRTARIGGVRYALGRAAELIRVKLGPESLLLTIIRTCLRSSSLSGPTSLLQMTQGPELVLRRGPTRPIISVLLPVNDTPRDILTAAIRSVYTQSYGKFELCISDNASTMSDTLEVLTSWRGVDSRVKVIQASVKSTASATINACIPFISGRYIVVLAMGEAMTFDALAQVAEVVGSEPDTDLLYGERQPLFEPNCSSEEPKFKPDIPLLVARKSLFLSLGGFRDTVDQSPSQDFWIRATPVSGTTVCLPSILCHQRDVRPAGCELTAAP